MIGFIIWKIMAFFRGLLVPILGRFYTVHVICIFTYSIIVLLISIFWSDIFFVSLNLRYSQF